MEERIGPMENSSSGRCLCGAIRFVLTGRPIYNVICHCENCKRQGGSIFHTASIYPKNQYELLAGEEQISTYEDHATMSGKPLLRRFCSICGSKIAALTPLSTEIISVPAGIQDSVATAWGPGKEQFCRDRATWLPDFGQVSGDQKHVEGPLSEAV